MTRHPDERSDLAGAARTIDLAVSELAAPEPS